MELLPKLCIAGVISCNEKAKQKRTLSDPVIIHSVRGSQYVSKDNYKTLDSKFRTSYSRKANPWDNDFIESYNALSKHKWLSKYCFENFSSLKAVLKSIEVYIILRELSAH